MKPGTRVVITRKGHCWHGQAGELVAEETYGLGWKGWRTKLDNGFETYVTEKEVRIL